MFRLDIYNPNYNLDTVLQFDSENNARNIVSVLQWDKAFSGCQVNLTDMSDGVLIETWFIS